jgi:serine/threonine protein kinase
MPARQQFIDITSLDGDGCGSSPVDSPTSSASPVTEAALDDEWEMVEPLHTTLLGRIFTAVSKFDPTRCAIVKESNLNQIKPHCKESPLNEAKYLRLFGNSQNPNLFPKILEENKVGNQHWIVMENGGKDIATVIQDHGAFTETEARSVWKQLLDGLVVMHQELKLCHLDIKPDNLLLEHGSLRLCDFGQTRSVTDKPRGVFGTASYRAPEQRFLRTFDGEAADMFSCGATLLVCLTGTGTFSVTSRKQTDLWHNILANDARLRRLLTGRLPRASPEVIDLLARLMCPPAQRLTLQEALDHPWTRD